MLSISNSWTMKWLANRVHSLLRCTCGSGERVRRPSESAYKKKYSDAFLRHKRGKKCIWSRLTLQVSRFADAQTAPRFQSRPNKTPSIHFLSTAATSLTFTIRRATFANNKIWQFPPGTTNEFKKKSLRKRVCERLRRSHSWSSMKSLVSKYSKMCCYYLIKF